MNPCYIAYVALPHLPRTNINSFAREGCLMGTRKRCKKRKRKRNRERKGKRERGRISVSFPRETR